MTVKTFHAYSDSGHAWVKVSKDMLKDLNISDQITGYSYMRNDFAYLEEDVDLTTFYNAYKAKYNVEPVFNAHYSDRSKIRTYEHYTNK